jgi:DNA-binding NarL/FixJ family response regulator
MNGRRIKVLLVDDHPVVRAGISSLLEDSAVAALVASCSGASEARTLVKKAQPDVVLVDFVLEHGNGFDLARDLLDAGCRSRLVLFTGHDNGRVLAESALAAGFCGFLSKSAVAMDLEECLRIVDAGGYWWDGPAEAVAL